MPKFRFAVRTKEGKLRTGSVTEASQDAAKDRLKGAGFIIVSLQEEAELVIHEAKAPTGVGRPKTERVDIIEFEVSFGERVMNFLGRFVLRKEFAVVLFLLGGAWGAYQYVTRPKPVVLAEPKFLPVEVEVTVDPGSFAGRGKVYEVILPDIPVQFSQLVTKGSLVKYSFESTKQPGRAEVRLVDESKTVLATGEGLLSSRPGGVLAGEVPLSAVKKARP